MAAIESISRTLSCFNLFFLELKCLLRDSLRLNADAPVRISKPYCRRCFEGESLLSTNVSGNKRKRRNKRMNKYPAMNRRVSSALLDRKPNAQGSKPFATRARHRCRQWRHSLRERHGFSIKTALSSPLPAPLSFPSSPFYVARSPQFYVESLFLFRRTFYYADSGGGGNVARHLSLTVSPPTSLKRRNESVC